MEPWFHLDPFQRGRGETCIDAIILSAARIFRRLRDFPLLADLDLFSARNFRSAVRVNPPSLDATSAPLVHLFPRNFVERATPSPPLLPALPPAALFIYRRICRASCGERDQENLWCTQVRRSLPTRRAEEKLRLGRSKLFEKFSKLFFFLLLFSSSIHFL